MFVKTTEYDLIQYMIVQNRGVHTRPEPDPNPTRPESRVRSG